MPELLDIHRCPFPAILISEHGTVLSANAAAAAVMGMQARELGGWRIETLIPERFRGVFRAAAAECLASSNVAPSFRHFGASVVGADGSERPAQMILGQIEAPEERVLFLGLVPGARALGAGGFEPGDSGEERAGMDPHSTIARLLLECADDPIYWTASDGVLAYANDAACRSLGYLREELIGMTLDEIDLHFVPSRWPSHWMELKSHGSLRFESQLRRKDGVCFPVEIRTTYIDCGGREYGCTVARDVTGRKRTEDALWRSEERHTTARKADEARLLTLAAAVDQSPVSVVITDNKGNIEFVNPRFTQVSQYTREEVIGKNPRILKSGEMPPSVYRKLWSTITSGQEWRGELLNRTKDGSLFWEHASISPVFAPDGTITHFIAVKEEITERKRLEQQLLQSQKMEAVGQLAGGVAHDFNNLLTAILCYTDLLLPAFAPGDPKRIEVEEIRRAAQQASSLTSQLLAFSRRQLLRPVVLNLNEVIGTSLKMIVRLIGEDIRVVTELLPELWCVKADPVQIEQVLLNLAVNARDAMPEGGVLAIETANVELDREYALAHNVLLESGPYVMVAVSDTGCGMDEETRARAFEPFFTTKEPGKGTGLGLSSVYGFVKQSGGYIWLHSQLGHGSTFKIYLPRADEDRNEVPEGPIPEALSGSETILLVEDHELLLRLTRKVLEGFGYTVLAARNTEEALALCAEHGGPIDLLLTDVVLPTTNGRKLAELVSAARPEIKVLYSSGYPDERMLRHGVLREGEALIQKPYTSEGLAREIRCVLEARGGRR